MHLHRKLGITIYLLCTAVFSVFGQEKIPLTAYIPILEERFDISFSYLEQHIENSTVMPLDNLQRHNLLFVTDALEKQTHLRFEQVSNTRYTIRPLKSKDLVSVCGLVKDQFKKYQTNFTIESSKNQLLSSVNEEGSFTIPKVPFGESIFLKREGMVIRSLAVKELFGPRCYELVVYNRDIKLKEVVVQNYLSKGFKLKSEKVVFKPSKFKVIAGLTTPDVMQAIQQVPGVISPFESASRIFIRGGTPDQNLVRWNGITTYNQSHFFGMLSAFNPNVIDEVDFYKKSVNAKYGNRVGGVVEMKTTDSISNVLSGSIGTNLLHADANIEIPIIKNRLSLTTSFRRSFTDVWASPTYSQLSDRIFQNSSIANAKEGENNFFFHDATFSLNAQPTFKDRVQLNVLSSKNDLEFSNNSELESQEDQLITQNFGLSANWKRKWNTQWSHETNLYNSQYLLDYSFLLNKEGENKSNARTNFVNDIGGETWVSYTKENSIFSFGGFYALNSVRYAFETIESDFEIQLDNNKNDLTTRGAFLEYSLFKKRNYKLSLGVRASDYSSASGLFFEPRVFVEKQYGHVKLNASYNKQTQAVTQIRESEFSTLSLENLIWRATENSFEIVRGDHYNIGATYKHRAWFFETEAYYKQLKNITSFSSGFLNILDNKRSIGESRTYGAEVFVKRKFRQWESWLSYTFLNQKNRFETLNNNRFYKSNINIDHTFKWVTNLKWKQWNASTSWLLHTGKTSILRTKFIEEDGVPLRPDPEADLILGKLPLYHRLDASVKYTFKKREASRFTYNLGLSVQNIYNFQTVINREFRISPGLDGKLLTYDYTSLGITPNVSFRVAF